MSKGLLVVHVPTKHLSHKEAKKLLKKVTKEFKTKRFHATAVPTGDGDNNYRFEVVYC
jgi:hypothetical protein